MAFAQRCGQIGASMTIDETKISANADYRKIDISFFARKLNRQISLLALVLGYIFVILFPFNWQLPSYDANPVGFLAGQSGLQFLGTSVARTELPPVSLGEIIETGEFALGLELETMNSTQLNARIFTVSSSHTRRNLSVFQDRSDLVVRLRTAETDVDGRPEYRVARVFADQISRKIDVTAADGRMEIYVDGVRRTTAELPNRPFSNWNQTFRLALGNELDPQRERALILCRRVGMPCAAVLDPVVAVSDSAWMGIVAKAELRTRSSLVDYAKAGNLVIPRKRWLLHGDPEILPFYQRDLPDAAFNLILFVPLGFLLAVGWRRSTRLTVIVRTAAIAVIISVALELAQLALPTRFPSVMDIIMNASGALFGAVLVLNLRARQPTNGASPSRG